MKAKKRSRLLQYLVMAVMVTSLAATGTLAKYTSTFSGRVTYQVASFALGGGVVSFNTTLENMYPGMDPPKTVSFTVQNYEGTTGCDVPMEYEIQVETTGNLPLEFSLAGPADFEGDEDDQLVGGLNGDLLAAGGKLPIAGADRRIDHTYTLTVSWEDGKTAWDYSQEIDVLTVTVTAKQIDPGAISPAEPPAGEEEE